MKAWNSTFNVSKRRLKKTPMRRVSAKKRARDASNHNRCMAEYGNGCILCGKPATVHHHFQFTQAQRPDLRDEIRNMAPMCHKCHGRAHWDDNAEYYDVRDEIICRLRNLGKPFEIKGTICADV